MFHKTRLFGFGVLALLYTEVFAETNKLHPPTHSASNTIANALKKSDHLYGMQLNLGGFYGSTNKGASSDNSYGMVDVLLPLYQTPDSLYFFDIRGLRYNSNPYEFNVGLGYRMLLDDASKLLGMYVFYDYRNSEANKTFQQVTFGGEYKQGSWSLGANYYLPVGETKQRISSTTVAKYVETTGNILYGFNNSYEQAMHGVDGELGYTFGDTGLTAYLGGYYFYEKGVESITGPRGTLNLNLVDTLNMQSDHLDAFSLEASVQHDKPRGTNYYAGVRLSFGFGGAPNNRLNKMQRSMTDFVRRDLDVVVGQANHDVSMQTLYSTIPGFESVAITAELYEELPATMNEKTKIHVLTKDQVITSNQGLSLSGGIITSGTYSFERDGKTFTVTFGEQKTLSINDNNYLSSLISVVGDGSSAAQAQMEIQGITLSRPDSSMSIADAHALYLIKADSDSEHFQLTIHDNNLIGGSLKLKGADTSQFTITNNTMNTTGKAAAESALYLGENKKNVFVVTGNNITSTVEAYNSGSNLAVMMIHSDDNVTIENNVITSNKNLDLTSSTTVIYVEPGATAQVSIKANTINEIVQGNYSSAILHLFVAEEPQNLSNNGMVNLDSNIINLTSSGTTAKGFLVSGDGGNNPYNNIINKNTISLTNPQYNFEASDWYVQYSNIAATITDNIINNLD